MGWFVLAGGVLIALAVLGWGIPLHRRRKARRERAIRALGFTACAPGDALTDRVREVYRTLGLQGASADADFELRSVHRRRIEQGDLYLFDLHRTDGGEDLNAGQKVMAVMSPRLNLPPVALFPKSPRRDRTSKLANRTMEWMMKRVGNVVDVPGCPEFDQRFVVSSPRPDDVRGFLVRDRLRRLARSEMISVHAGGNLFTVVPFPATWKGPDAAALKEQAAKAEELFAIFAGR